MSAATALRPCLLALVVLAAAACTTQTEEPQIEDGSTTTESLPSTVAAEGGGSTDEGGSTAQIGDTLTLKGTSYKVTSVKTQHKVGDNELTETKADGIFVVVKLTLTNEKDEPATIVADLVRLVGGNGKEYSVDTDALFAFDNALVLLEEIQPDLAKKVVAVYDIPPKAVAGAKLRVKDFWSDSAGEIDLALE